MQMLGISRFSTKSAVEECRRPAHAAAWARAAVSRALLGAGMGVLLAGAAVAATVVPLSGQSPEQMAMDQQQCSAQATSQSGYNPAAAPAAAPTPQAGQRVGGAVRGAAAGKVVSNVTKNSTDEAMEGGAKLGAMAGGTSQRRANRDSRQQTQTQQQQAGAYNNAFAACLQARGYTVQ